MLLSVKSITKAFATPVLKRIDFHVAPGEVVALTGENGAGKSTLSKIIAGLLKPDAGEMLLNGQPYAPASRTSAEHSGVRMVLQELGLIENLSIAENLQLGQIPSRAGFIRHAELYRIARQQLESVGLSGIDPALPVSELGIGQQQLVEIARGLMGETRLLILDEPTAMLTEPEIARLFQQVARLKARDVGLIYISHRLDELSRIADRVVVLRDGELIVDRPQREMQHDDIVRAMVGHEPVQQSARSLRPRGRELLRVHNLKLHAGEIVGLAGLVGSGRTELLRAIFGADSRTDIYLDGASTPTPIRSPADAVKHGIGLLTEDRKTQGLLLTQPLGTNLTLANLRAVSRRGWISASQEQLAAAHWSQKLRIRARDIQQTVAELSGGNQQKVLLARWLHRDCRILLLDEPTRGIDVGAREDIYAELEILAAAGKGLLMVSSDLRELMALCDRIAVMSAGKLAQVFERGQWTEQLLLDAAFSGFRDTAQARSA